MRSPLGGGGGVFCLWIAIFAAHAVLSYGGLFGRKERRPPPDVIPLTPEVLSDNLDHWTHDYAVMFYAPWCPHCKQFGPYWEAVASELNASKDDKNVLVSKFDCEASDEAMEFCHHVGVTHYPTLMVFGFGEYPDHDPFTRWFLNKSTGVDKAVKYQGLIYFEAVYDWVRTMVGISRFYRMEYRIKSALGLTATKDPLPMIRRLKDENHSLREQNEYLASLVQEAYGGSPPPPPPPKQLETYDIFAELGVVDWATDYIPVIACVADRANEYCDVVVEAGLEEPFCNILMSCIMEDFAPDACRPASCPFGREGCTHVNTCLDEDEIARYMAMYEEALSAAEKA